MAIKILKKEFVEDVNVYDAALERFRYLFDNFDKVVVSFSGGKDSTVCLNLAWQVAREKNKLPLDVYFWDEEAIHPETIEYVERVRANPEIRFKWLCIPIKHRNGCSRKQPYWHCWHPEEKDKWVRDMPDDVITHIEGFKWGDSVPDIAHLVYGPEHGTVADVRGIRADESLRRYRSVAMKTKNNWIGGPRNGHNYPVSPIFDWTTFDVWTAPRMFGWDYNKSYDLMSMIGVSPSSQRVCPPYGEEPLGGLWIYAQCWPLLWHKMIGRVHGAATAGRYANTELYGFGKLTLPDGMTWRDWTYALLELYPKDLKAKVAKNISQLIEQHKSKTNRPIHETEADLHTGLSWKFLAMIANRADLKDRRKGNVASNASLARDKLGLELADITEDDNGTRY
jgi:predicted phosphoadenosine phosphosulfate sulfurtransferase